MGHGPTGLIYCNENGTTLQYGVAYYGWEAPGGGVYYNLTVSDSANGGATWTDPTVVATQFVPEWQGIGVRPFIENPSISVGAAPDNNFTIIYADTANLTSTGVVPVAQLTSTDGGASWSRPADSGVMARWVGYVGPGWFANSTAPRLATDNWTTSPYERPGVHGLG